MFNVEALEKIAQAVLGLANDMPTGGKYDFYAGNVYFVKFKRKEVKELPQEFRAQFVEQGSTVHLRVDSVNGVRRYTLRYSNFGYFIEVTGGAFKAVKAEFIEQVKLRYGEAGSVSTVQINVENGAEVARLGY